LCPLCRESIALAISQSLELHQKIYGPEHPAYATPLVNLAALLVRMGKFEEAERDYLEAIALDSKIYSENSFQTAGVKSLLGECLTKTKKFPQYLRSFSSSCGQDERLRMSSLSFLYISLRWPTAMTIIRSSFSLIRYMIL
jgi:tetratricopeptide (TPR) repeat protein